MLPIHTLMLSRAQNALCVSLELGDGGESLRCEESDAVASRDHWRGNHCCSAWTALPPPCASRAPRQSCHRARSSRVARCGCGQRSSRRSRPERNVHHRALRSNHFEKYTSKHSENCSQCETLWSNAFRLTQCSSRYVLTSFISSASLCCSGCSKGTYDAVDTRVYEK